MSSPYTSVPVVGFNNNPPADDGSKIQSNQLDWDTHLSKIGNPLLTAVQTIDANLISAFTVLYGQTAAEASALITSTSGFLGLPLYDVRRAGIVPNNPSAATANTTAAKLLWDPTKTGPKGVFLFPNTTGNDTYHFNDRIPIRDDCYIDGMGCELKATRTGDATDSDTGFLRFVRRSGIKNATITIDYTHTSGSNTFNAITFAGRDADNDFADFFDDLAAPYGDIVIENVKVDHNGGINCNAILAYSAVRNVLIRNFHVEGNGTLKRGILYEYGFATNEVALQDRQSSHAYNWRIENMTVENMDSATSGAAITWTGGYNLSIDGLTVRKAFNGFLATPGEAKFWNPWDPENEAASRQISIRNFVCSEIESIGITVAGALSNATGYLSGVSIPDEKLVDLYDLTVDGFSILGGTGGTTLSVGIDTSCGSTVLKNGTIDNATNGIRANDEAIRWNVENIRIINCTGTPVRLSFAGGIFSTERKKNGSITDSFFGGNEGDAIIIDHADNFYIGYCRFGNTTGHNGVAETTQDAAIQVGADAHVIADSNNVAAVTAGEAYTGLTGGVGILRNPRGIITSQDEWRIDSEFNDVSTFGDVNLSLTVGTDNETQLTTTNRTANRTHTLNTTNATKGNTFTVTHNEPSPGAFTVDVGGVFTIPSGSNGSVTAKFNGTVWQLHSAGTF